MRLSAKRTLCIWPIKEQHWLRRRLHHQSCRKIAPFQEGRKLIEQAIAIDEANAELRFLRLSVQVKAPYFLGYSDNIIDDRELLIQFLHESKLPLVDNDFTAKVLSFVSLYAEPTQDQLKLISDLQSKL